MLRVKIFGKTWKVYCLSPDRYEKTIGPDSAGVTVAADRAIFFNEEDFCHELVVHETCHAFVAGLCVNAADLTTVQLEEVIVEMIANYHESIFYCVKQIEKHFS